MPKTEHKIHPAQASILKAVLYRNEARFSEMNTEKLPSDQFTFHIKQLLHEKILEKSGQKYRLTAKGKEFANRFDTDSSTILIERQAKIGVLVTCVDTSKKIPRYLVQQRLKQPYYGFYGFVTGKVKWGETILEAAARELAEEVGLRANLSLCAVKHKMDYSPEGGLLEDKFFFLCMGEKPQGTFMGEFPGGKNFWMTKRELLRLPDLFDGVQESLAIAHNKSFTFLEKKYRVKRY